MPNGGYDGSIEDFNKIEAPLIEIDPLLAQFAAARKLELVKDHHNCKTFSDPTTNHSAFPQRELRMFELDLEGSDTHRDVPTTL